MFVMHAMEKSEKEEQAQKYPSAQELKELHEKAQKEIEARYGKAKSISEAETQELMQAIAGTHPSEQDAWVIPKNEKEALRIPERIVKLSTVLKAMAPETNSSHPLPIEYSRPVLELFMRIAGIIVDIQQSREFEMWQFFPSQEETIKGEYEKGALNILHKHIFQKEPIANIFDVFVLAHNLDANLITTLLTKEMPILCMNQEMCFQEVIKNITSSLFNIPNRKEFKDELIASDQWLSELSSRLVIIQKPIKVDSFAKGLEVINLLAHNFGQQIFQGKKYSKELLEKLEDHARIAYNPDATLRVVATQRTHGGLELQKLENKIWKPLNFSSTAEVVSCVSWSPDGKIIVSGSSKFIRFWHLNGNILETGNKLGVDYVHAMPGAIALSWSPDSKILAVGSGENRFWLLTQVQENWQRKSMTVLQDNEQLIKRVEAIIWNTKQDVLFLIYNGVTVEKLESFSGKEMGEREHHQYFVTAYAMPSIEELSINQIMLILILEQLNQTDEGKGIIKVHKTELENVLLKYPLILQKMMQVRYDITPEKQLDVKGLEEQEKNGAQAQISTPKNDFEYQAAQIKKELEGVVPAFKGKMVGALEYNEKRLKIAILLKKLLEQFGLGQTPLGLELEKNLEYAQTLHTSARDTKIKEAVQTALQQSTSLINLGIKIINEAPKLVSEMQPKKEIITAEIAKKLREKITQTTQSEIREIRQIKKKDFKDAQKLAIDRITGHINNAVVIAQKFKSETIEADHMWNVFAGELNSAMDIAKLFKIAWPKELLEQLEAIQKNGLMIQEQIHSVLKGLLTRAEKNKNLRPQYKELLEIWGEFERDLKRAGLIK